MASNTVGRVILMSIHPSFADAIIQGEKLVEFRKRRIANDVTHVLLYATHPVSAIVGAFSVKGQLTSSPTFLWESFDKVAGIGLDLFNAYYSAQRIGTGIRIGCVFEASSRFCLSDAFGMRRPPQSYQYVDTERAVSLLEMMTQVQESKLELNSDGAYQLPLNAPGD